MGYTQDTHFSQFISPALFNHSAGTWTVSLASNVVKAARGTADASFTTTIPIPIPSNASALKGSRLKSIDVWYTIATAADDFATVELEKVTLPANTVTPTGAAVSAVTLDADHDTAAKRLAAASHKMTVTLTTPTWIDDDEAYYLTLIVDCAAGTVFTFWGARANFDVRQ